MPRLGGGRGRVPVPEDPALRPTPEGLGDDGSLRRAITPKLLLPVIGVGISIALLTQVEAETSGRAGLLMLLGVALWAINAVALRGET